MHCVICDHYGCHHGLGAFQPFFFLTSMDLLPLNREENFMLVGNLN